jgi:D-aspartate ligase
MSYDVPAVVIGAGINGLGVARSLYRARIPAWILDKDPRRPEMHTRAARAHRLAGMHGSALVGGLLALAHSVFEGHRPVLLLTQEESVKTVSDYRDELLPHYRFTLPPVEVVNLLLRKEGFQRVAEHLGAPIPPLAHVCSVQDLPSLRRLNYPVVVKPNARNAEYASRFKKAYRIERAEDAEILVTRILQVMPDVVVQEWTEGPDSNIFFCLQYLSARGDVVASFTGRKVRSWPPQTGGTASCLPAPEMNEELSRVSERFFRDSGVVGMAGMEYKRNARTGKFMMVEPTIGRTDYQEEIASLNGVNLPAAAYCSELDLPVQSVVPSNRAAAWRLASDDTRSAAAQGHTAREGFESATAVVDALWRWSDPLPSLHASVQRVRRSLQGRVARLKGSVRAAGSKQ